MIIILVILLLIFLPRCLCERIISRIRLHHHQDFLVGFSSVATLSTDTFPICDSRCMRRASSWETRSRASVTCFSCENFARASCKPYEQDQRFVPQRRPPQSSYAPSTRWTQAKQSESSPEPYPGTIPNVSNSLTWFVVCTRDQF